MSNPREVPMVSFAHTRPRFGAKRALASAFFGVLALMTACQSSNPATIGPGTGTNGGTTPLTTGITCLHDAPGCACTHEGAVIQCGVTTDADGGTVGTGSVRCAMGGQICENGQWSSCLTNSNDPGLQTKEGLKLVTGIKVQALSPGQTCAGDPCDPYCFAYPDTAPGVNPGTTGVSNLGCNDAGVLTVVTTGNPDASVAPASVIADAALQDGEGYLYMDLPPGAHQTVTFLTPPPNNPNVDIYFLIDDTSSMGPASANLAGALTGTNGIISEIQGQLKGVTLNFGVGRFEDFSQLPYAAPESSAQPSSTNPYNLPYQHLLSMQNDQGTITPPSTSPSVASLCGNTGANNNACTAAAVTWLTEDAFDSLVTAQQSAARSGGDIPEGSVAALWMAASGNGLYYTNTTTGSTQPYPIFGALGPTSFTFPGGASANSGNWWQVPRSEWPGTNSNLGTGPWGFNNWPGEVTGPCQGSGVVPGGNYPCFNVGSTHVIVLLSDAPAHEGPGGQYPHVNEIYPTASTIALSPHLTGANPWPTQPPVEYALDGVTKTWNGGCPSMDPAGVAYDPSINVGGSGNVCQLTEFTANTQAGLSFASAVPLPVGLDGLPVSGVYYGHVPVTPRAPPGSSAPANWYSASSVGGGVFTIPAVPASGLPSPFSPGQHLRSSLRDCSSGDEAFECTPTVSGGGSTCYDNLPATPTWAFNPTLTSGAATYASAATLTYTLATNTPAATASTPTDANFQTSIAATAGTFTVENQNGGGAPTGAAANTAALFLAATTAQGTLQTDTAATAGAYTATASASVFGVPTTEILSLNTASTNYTLPVALTAGQGITFTLTLISFTQGQSISVTASSGGFTTGALTSTAQGPVSQTYYLGTTAGTPVIAINQGTHATASGTMTVELQYQVLTPPTCTTSSTQGAAQLTGAAASGTPTTYCPSCTYALSTWSTSTKTCSYGCSSTSFTLGLGTYASTCFSNTCPDGTALITSTSTTTTPPTCQPACYTVSGNTKTAMVNAVLSTSTDHDTGGTNGNCYYCGTSSTSGSNSVLAGSANNTAWSCPVTGCPAGSTKATAAGTYAPSGTIAINQCGTCAYTPATPPTATVYSLPTVASNVWSCPTLECLGSAAGWTLAPNANLIGGTHTFTANQCYACNAATGSETTPVIDPTQTGGTICSTCSTAVGTAALDTGLTKYKCETCAAGTTLTGSTTTTPTCNSPATCDAAWTTGTGANAGKCLITNACSKTANVGSIAAGSISTVLQTTNAPGTGWGLSCANSVSSACTTDTVLYASSETSQPACFLSTTTFQGGPVAGNQGCGCEEVTYSAGSATTYVQAQTGGPCGTNTYNMAGSSTTGCSGNISPGTTCVAVLPANIATTCPGGGAGLGYVECTNNGTGGCTATSTDGGEGYFGNDLIYKFTVPAGTGYGARYYYHFALLAYGPAGAASTWVTGGAPGGGTSVPATVKPFLYIKSASGTSMNDVATTGGPQDQTYPYVIPASSAASDYTNAASAILVDSGANGSVIDCNKSAHNELEGPVAASGAPASDSYVVSEVDGYLPPGTYYLVVDNATPGVTSATFEATPPLAYQYFLQVGGFDDVPANLTTPPSYTQPSYNQMVRALKTAGLGAKFVGIENSGLSCLLPGDVAGATSPSFDSTQISYAQYETRDWMEKLAIDLGSDDPNISNPSDPRPYVVPVRANGSSCNPPCTLGMSACSGTTGYCATHFPHGMSADGPLVAQHALQYDPPDLACSNYCTSNSDCPINTPYCSTTNYCTTASPLNPTGCGTGVSGLSCAVIAAVGNLTNNAKSDVYLRPLAVGSGTTYQAPPGGSCTSSATCSTALPDCYGGTCTIACNTAADCATASIAQPGLGLICAPSTIPSDPNHGYCLSPAVFVYSVAAISTDVPGNPMAMPPILPSGSDAVCGFHPGVPGSNQCTINANCSTYPGLPTCIQNGPSVDTCGISDTGPDTYNPPAYAGENATLAANEMFNQCSPSAQVEFAVTFQMPFQRSATAQQYEFELVIYQGTTRVSHTRVIIENPALSVADFYRDYDSTTVCPSGTHVVWGNFTYSALCPTDGSVPFSSAQDYSQIRFCGETATSADASFKLVPNGVSDQPFNLTNSANGGCAPGEVLLGIATANPDPSGTTGPGVQSGGFYNTCPASGTPGMGYSCAPTTPSTATAAAWGACTANTTSATCAAATAGCTWNAQTGFNVGAVLQASGVARDAGLASDRYLRIRMEFDPSAPSDAVAPWLYSWNLDVDCIPSE